MGGKGEGRLSIYTLLMLLIKTRLAPSTVHGIGLFAAEPIMKGTEVWKFVRGFDQEFPKNFPATLAPAAREQFLNYAYVSRATGTYILCTDDMRFINHFDAPNILSTQRDGEQEGVDVAARDIQLSEELLYDYRVFADPLP
jgi:hypothetical protein